MEDIFRVKNTDYSRYEELLMRKDKLKKEGFQYQQEYLRVFGEEIAALFEKKIECIRKKKMITYCQAVLNHGGQVDSNELQAYLAKEMESYEEQLSQMLLDNEIAKSGGNITELELMKIKKIYRKLAKKMHPDINPLVSEKKELRDLWEQIQVAYNCNDIDELQALEFMTEAALAKLGIGVFELDIPDIGAKIAALEEEIEMIKTTEPYTYRYLLEDEEAAAEKHDSLQKEMESYKVYEKQLEDLLADLIARGVTITWRMN